MIVQGGKTFLGNAGLEKKNSNPKEDSQSFQDVLQGTQHKKRAPEQKTSEKPVQEKTKNIHEAPVQAENQVPQKTIQVKPIEEKATEVVLPVVKPEAKPVEELPLQATKLETTKGLIENQNIVDKKFAEGAEKGTQVVDSLNLSEPKTETLGKNEKILQDLKNSFEETMAQVKPKQALPQENLAKNNLAALAAVKPPVKNLQGGKMKLDPAMKLTEGGETLQLNSLGEKMDLKGLTQKQDDTGDSAQDLDSMLNQIFEQDFSMDQTDNKVFSEELAAVQNSGKEEKIENMQSIVKQARAFIDDGGGSMEIHLQPEGLGKVQLKVAVNDGQVNVEMLADNVHAKKALEEGLFDIKSALEGQKLLVETLKVEMSPDYQKDFSDLQQHMQEQANRDFAEQFLGQFRQEREERFGGLFDSFRNFQPGPKEPELTLSRNPYVENGKGRAVNLVA